MDKVKNLFITKKSLILSVLTLVLTIGVGVSFAYFSANIGDPESESTIVIGGAEMTIAYDDASPAINVSNIYPKDEAWATKTFTLTGTNTAEFDMAYQIALAVDSNTFTDNALTYTLSSENTSDSGVIAPSITEQVGIPTGTNSVILGEGKFIQKASDKIHTYTFNLFFPETGTDQNANQEKVFTAHIRIDSYNATRSGVKLAMQTVAKDGTITGITEAPTSGNYFLKKNCTGADVTYENNTLNATATDVLAYCSLEFKEPFNITTTAASGYTLGSLTPEVIGYDDTLTINYTPAAHYNYQSATCTGTHGTITNTGNAITVPNVKSDMSCTINMEIETYSVTITTPSGYTLGTYTNPVNHGSSVTINYTPATNYVYQSTTCTGTHGAITNSGNTVTIANVTSDISCTLNMEATPIGWTTAESGTLLNNIKSTMTLATPQTTPGQAISTAEEAVLASTPDDYGTSYYYRGAVENNYVSFANMCWRIVRVTGNGAIKLVLYNYNPSSASNPCDSTQDGTTNAFARYSGDTYTTAFNANNNQNAYIGFMYGTAGSSSYGAEHANNNKSTILTNLEAWYNAKLSSYSSKLADTIWCNDKSTKSTYTVDGTAYGNGLGYSTNQTMYGARDRIYANNKEETGASPTLICANDNNGGKLSKFTADDVAYGNGALTYKIGLLTADEVAFAGGIYGNANSTYYLNKNASGNHWWSLSPYVFNGSYAYEWGVSSAGYLGSTGVGNTVGLRPAVSLSSATTATGSGTQTDPWKIQS